MKCGAILAAALAVLVSLIANSHTYAYKEIAVPASVKLSSRLQILFEKTKVLCFGRYAVEVPQEAQLIYGSAVLRHGIEVLTGGLEQAKHRADKKFEEVKFEDRTAEITYNGPGPITDSWQLRYFEDKYNKTRNALFFQTYVIKGNITFIIDDAISLGENENLVIARQQERANSLRLRAEDEVPTEPGFCVEHGFMPGDHYGESEQISAGIYLPSLPDVSSGCKLIHSSD